MYQGKYVLCIWQVYALILEELTLTSLNIHNLYKVKSKCTF